jgi:Concanavalin A-like lectin/glucanases superfamily
MTDHGLDAGRVPAEAYLRRTGGRRPRGLRAALVAALVCVPLMTTIPVSAQADAGPAVAGHGGPFGSPGLKVLPGLKRNLVAYYDFDHPLPGTPAVERDRGFSGTDITLVNGGAAMRVRDRAFPGSRYALQTKQVNPDVAGNDDWKAGIYAQAGVPSLHAFNGVKEASIMGWFKMTGPNPNPNSNTADPSDYYDAVGLAGVLSGNSQGHNVRALLEVIDVSGQLRVVALGRRVDTGSSQTFAANEDWQSVLPQNTWVFLAATFDFDNATMRLYKNGRPLDGFYTLPGDPWAVSGPPEPDVSSATDPSGIKIGGSYPQNTKEGNPCNCRMDSLMFLNRVVTPREVWQQYHWALARRH